MPTERKRIRQPWSSGFGAGQWQGDDQPVAALLDALTRERLTTEAVERELVSSARRDQADVLKAHERQARDEMAEAREVLTAFREALLDAHSRSDSAGRGASYDNQDPRQDEQADLLIQYVVRPGYADVETEEAGPGHYVYRIRIDWDRLRALAAEQGHPFLV